MDSTKREYPFVYVYMTESIDGKASGEILNAPSSKFGKDYYGNFPRIFRMDKSG